MKLVIAADIFSPDIGGPATYSSTLLRELPKRNIAVQVVCYSDAPGTDVVRVVRQGLAVSRYVRYALALWREAKTADVVYAMGPVSAGFPALLVAKLRHKPLVVKVVGDYAWEQATNAGAFSESIEKFQHTKPIGKFFILRLIQRLVCRHAIRVVVPSRYLSRIVAGWGIAHDRISVIYNAVEEANVEPASQNILKMVTVGRLVSWKHIDALIDATVVLHQEFPQLQLQIIGDGPLRDSLKLKAQSVSSKAQIQLAGKFDAQQTRAAVAAATVFVLNSSYEGLPFVAVEAASLHVPIIATDAGGTTEVVVNNVNGLVVPVGDQAALVDALRKILNDEALRTRLASAGLDKQFSLPVMVNATVTLLQSVCVS